MEKFSAFRDPGTGIQPFLPPVPPLENDPFVAILLPIRSILFILRTFVVVVIAVLYYGLHYGLCTLLIPIPLLRRLAEGLCTRLLARLALYILGFAHVHEEIVTRKRGKLHEMPWNPQAGDIIVSNWTSWVDVLWIAYRFNPIFVMPVVEEPKPSVPVDASVPLSYRPGRNKVHGASTTSVLTRTTKSRSAINGFHPVSLFAMIQAAGHTPEKLSSTVVLPLQELRRSAQRPIVIFPECTTSNGRGLLRFAEVFQGFDVPVKQFNVFIMCIRYDPPTSRRSSPSHPIASSSLNPLRHLFALLSSLSPQLMSVRMLPLSESPSSQLFMVNEVISEPTIDTLSEICAILMARIGKMKQVCFGWEDKINFLDLYWSSRR
ncbi:hypothetical protein V8B97DRAFT_1863355 [Scleroderma yunnanense]